MNNTISSYMSTIGKKGGNTTKKRHGKAHFVAMAKSKKKISTSKPLAK